MEFWLAIQCNRARARAGGRTSWLYSCVTMKLLGVWASWLRFCSLACNLVSSRKFFPVTSAGLLVTTVSRESLRRRSAAVPL